MSKAEERFKGLSGTGRVIIRLQSLSCAQTWGEKGMNWDSWSGPTFPAVSHFPALPSHSCSQASSEERVGAQPAWQQLWAASCIQLMWPQSPRCGCHRVVTAAVTDCKAGKRGASSPRSRSELRHNYTRAGSGMLLQYA